MADVDICNQALAELGTRSNIATLSEDTPEAYNCGLFYNRLRQALLRTAPWGFARKAIVLTEVGNAVAQTAQFPWGYAYRWPADAVKIRYVTPSQNAAGNSAVIAVTGQQVWYPGWGGPSRNNRFLVDSSTDEKLILSNLGQATAVYTRDVQNTDLFDPLFEEALVKALCSRLVMVLSGNVGLKQGFEGLAQDAIMRARVADGNEAVPTTDHTPDWIAARTGGSLNYAGQVQNEWGEWLCQWDAMPWGE